MKTLREKIKLVVILTTATIICVVGILFAEYSWRYGNHVGVLVFGLEGTTTDMTDLNPNATKCPGNEDKIEGVTGSISYSILPVDAHVTATNTKIKRLFNWRNLWPSGKGDD